MISYNYRNQNHSHSCGYFSVTLLDFSVSFMKHCPPLGFGTPVISSDIKMLLAPSNRISLTIRPMIDGSNIGSGMQPSLLLSFYSSILTVSQMFTFRVLR